MRNLKAPKKLALSLTALMLLSMLFQAFMPDAYAEDGPAKAASVSVSNDLINANGKVVVSIQLKEQPLALAPGNEAQLTSSQNALIASLAKYNVTELARLQHALNAVVVEVDATNINSIAREYNVKAIDRVYDSQIDDNDTVPYIGASTTSNPPLPGGLDGTGTVVAVLDSGVDYTHKNLGGPGTAAAYNDCYGQRNVTTYAALSTSCKALFGPNAPKVIGGYDFVGETWAGSGALSPDANPIDFEGHGTHVSDIITGVNPAFRSVAPGAKEVAFKVCSAVSSSCSGVAILQGLNEVIKWNQANPDKMISVVNMSLGASYGQQQNSSVAAVQNVTATGVLVVVSAGNSADKPYIVGSPSTAPGALSVAQTAVPSDKLFPIVLNRAGVGSTTIRNSVFQPWSQPLTTALSGPVQYGNGAGGNLDGCAAFAPGTFTGKIAFIDRGTCNISVKSSNATVAGAIAVIIGFVAPGDPSVFSKGGGTVFAPTFAISQADGNLFRTAPAGSTATIDPANALPLVGTMIGSSSRGPSISDQSIKPEIGAPGGSVSAIAGSGTGTESFSGTSGAAPMVAGSALLVKQQYQNWSPIDIKSLLMNTAFTGVQTLDSQANFYPTPITRIGAGEVRVNRAALSKVLVTVPNEQSAALSFGYVSVANTTKVLYKTIRIRNLTSQGRLYVISAGFRDPTDNNGAVVFQSGFPRNEWVDANSYRDIQVQIQVNGPQLKPWNLNASTGGGDGTTINGPEYDGYITINGGAPEHTATVPWQLFPHKSADTQIRGTYQGWNNGPVKVVQFANDLGVVPGKVDTFQLLATNGSLGPQPGIGASNSLIDLKAFGVRDIGSNLQFAMSTFGQRATPNYPAEFDVYIDTNNDGKADFVLYNGECASFGTDGRNCLFGVNLSNNRTTTIGFTTSTYNSGNMIYTLPFSYLGVASGQKIGAYVAACDNYFTGFCTDYLPGDQKGATNFATYTVGQPRFSLSALPYDPFQGGDNGNTFFVSNNGKQIQVNSTGSSAQSSATGLLFVYSDAVNPDREVEWLTLP